MTSREFCYWLQGVFEVGNLQELTMMQTTLIKQHLALVFKHDIDLSQGSQFHQVELNELRSPWMADWLTYK